EREPNQISGAEVRRSGFRAAVRPIPGQRPGPGCKRNRLTRNILAANAASAAGGSRLSLALRSWKPVACRQSGRSVGLGAVERPRAQILALNQLSGQSSAANARGDETSLPQSEALDQTPMPLPARSFAGSANLNQAPANKDTQAGVIAQLPRQPFPYRYPVVAPVTPSTTLAPSAVPSAASGN